MRNKLYIVTIGPSGTVSKINRGFHQKSPIFPTHMYFVPLLKGLHLELGIGAGVG